MIINSRFPDSWIHGAQDCRTFRAPAFQVHPFDPATFILRQNKCLNFEGPFIYLLVGEHTAFLLDTGARREDDDTPPPTRRLVDEILAGVAASRGGQLPKLVVGHSHSHNDHFGGDDELKERPDTFVVEPDLDSIRRAYGIADWPDGLGALELGGRTLTVIPTPGHEDHHVCVYDSTTGVLLSGDMLYPGKLVIDDWPAYRLSAARLDAFAGRHEVSFVLGAHVEMRNRPGQLFPIGATFQPDEHTLQLGPEHLREWAAACAVMGDLPRFEMHDDFALAPRGADA